MCLSNTYEAKPQKYAYKIFRDMGEGRIGSYMFDLKGQRHSYIDGALVTSRMRPDIIPEGVTLDSFVENEYDKPHYGFGFHCFRTRQGARDFIKAKRSFWGILSRFKPAVRKVEVFDIVVAGDISLNFSSLHIPGIVARRIIVLPGKVR